MTKIRYNITLITTGALCVFFLLYFSYKLSRVRQTDLRVVKLSPFSASQFSELTSREQSQIEELESIKLSVRNEMRMLEKERLELASEIVYKKTQLIRISTQVKSTQKQLISERENLRMMSISRQQMSNLDRGSFRGYQSDLREVNSPIYILGTGGRAEELTSEKGSSNVNTMDTTGYCTISDCFDINSCSVLHEPAVFLIQEQSDDSLTQLTNAFTLNSGFQLLEEPAAACFVIILTQSRDLDSVLTGLQTSNVWTNTSHSILLMQLIDHDTGHLPSIPSSLPSRVLLASPLAELRPGYDMLTPPLLSLDDLLQHQLDTWSELPLLTPLHRKYLFYFSGNYEGTHPSLLHQLEQLSSSLKTSVSIQLSCTTSDSLRNSWSMCGEQQDRLNSNRESVFSLIPSHSLDRGGSPLTQSVRLIEALYTGAVPVLCGDGIRLPYSEVIDWNKVVLYIPRNRLHELHYLLRQVSDDQLFSYKKQGRFIWLNYLSSAYRILLTSVTLMFSRLFLPPPFTPSYTPEVLYPPEDNIDSPYEVPWRWYPLLSQRSLHWDSPPGSYFFVHPTPWEHELSNSMQYQQGYPPSFSPLPPHLDQGSGIAGPLFEEFLLGNTPVELFTAVILTYKRLQLLLELLNRLRGVSFLHKVIVVWNDPDDVGDIDLPDIHVPILIVRGNGNSLNNRFLPYDHIETEAVLSLDDDMSLGGDEIQFAFRVWRENRDRLVGFPARFHIWDIRNNVWLYNSNYSCELSMVLTGAAFLHKYYLYLYSNWLPASIRRTVDEFMNCEDIAMNFLVAHLTRKPPIKVTSRWTFRCEGCSSLWQGEDHFSERHKCMNKFVHEFGYMPLMYTQYRADSVLFRNRLPSSSKCYENI